jgi:hypothetical protein
MWQRCFSLEPSSLPGCYNLSVVRYYGDSVIQRVPFSVADRLTEHISQHISKISYISFMYPFPLRKLLTSLEWTLLAIVAISQVFYLVFSRELNLYILLAYNCVGFIVFLGLGRIKTSHFSLKIIHTIVEFIWALGWALIGDLFVPTSLFAIIIIRSCLRVNEFNRAIVLIFALISSIVVQTQRTIAGNSLFPAFVKQSWKFWLAFICILFISFLFLYLMLNAALKYHRIQTELAAASGFQG